VLTHSPGSYIVAESGCWIWQRAISSTGYGVTSVAGRHGPAHRVMYERLKGAIPVGMQLDHLCRVRACVNPDHLEPVSQAENIRRARPSHCKHGHEFTEENTWLRYVPGREMPHRTCKQCGRDRQRGKRERLSVLRRPDTEREPLS
jgi:hypothetical protein